ncbi:hypothetical protein KF840_22755 [bacterium]|nr:hypothetical protein [bacterium]
MAGAALVALGWAGGARAQSHPAVNRPEIIEVGDPILISRGTLAAEMARNSDLRDWVRLYGPPDYAEVQQLELDPPFAPYEVRLYYVKGNAYLAFGRVHVAPSVYDYGVRKYIGKIDPGELDRLLTAAPAVDETTAPPAFPDTAPPWIVETTAVEGKPVTP